MRLRIGLKLGLIGALVLVLLIPLGMLDALVSERQQRGEEVAQQIAASSSRAQLLVGPLLVVEASRSVARETIVTENGQMRRVAETVREYDTWVVAPSDLDITGTLTTEQRSRGVFTALLYHGTQQLAGHFRIPPLRPVEGSTDQRIEKITLAIGVGDTRGIRALTLKLDGREHAPQPGSYLGWLPEGVHTVLYAAGADPAIDDAPLDRELPFAIDLQLSGTESLGWVPLGDQTHVHLSADWPHPGFFGNYLPERKTITDAGFDADWQVSRLSSNAQQQLAQCGTSSGECSTLYSSAFSVQLVEPVDRYLMTDRAMKYSLLFVLLIFGAVFFIEALKRIEVHALQYALTGLALATFFLLLLSLAEHIGFGLAYLLAAVACVTLIATYMAAVLGGTTRGIAFAGLLSALYGLLYGLLQSEDYALLMGALALFGLLATVMLLTRRLDWSTVGRPTLQAPPMAGQPAT